MTSIVQVVIEDPALRNLVIGFISVLIFIQANRIFNKSYEHFQDNKKFKNTI